MVSVFVLGLHVDTEIRPPVPLTKNQTDGSFGKPHVSNSVLRVVALKIVPTISFPNRGIVASPQKSLYSIGGSGVGSPMMGEAVGDLVVGTIVLGLGVTGNVVMFGSGVVGGMETLYGVGVGVGSSLFDNTTPVVTPAAVTIITP